MGLRQRRGTGVNRKVIGAAVVAGVLVVGGFSGVQFASAGETAKGAVIEVDGQQFDVAGCRDLQINGGNVQCDGQALEPVQEQGADEAAQLAQEALEASCDDFAASQAGAADDAAGEEAAGEKAGASPKKHTATSSKKSAAGEKQAGEKQAGEEQAGEEAGAQGADAAVADAQQALFDACLALAEAKAGADAGGADEAGAAEEAAEEPAPKRATKN